MVMSNRDRVDHVQTDNDVSATDRYVTKPSRRSFLAATGAAGFGGLTGCLGGGGSESVDEITVLAEGVADNLVLQEMTDQFTEEYDIEVTFETFGYNQVQESAATQVASGTSDYDVMTIDTYWVGDFARGEQLVPIGDRVSDSDMVSQDVYIDEVWDTVATFEGTNYTLPFWQWTLGAGYRQDILEDPEYQDAYEEEFGRELAPAETMEEYVEMSTWMTEYTDGEVNGSVLMGQRGTKANDQWIGIFQGMGGTFIDEEGNVRYGEYRDEAIQATEYFVELFENSAPSDSTSWGFPSVSEHMGAGDGFSAINYNIFFRNMQDTLGDSGQIRQYDTPGGSPAVGSWSLGIPSNLPDARIEAAWQFIEWVNTFENRKQRILNGGSPVCTDTLDDQEVIDSAPNLWSNLEDLVSGGKPISKYPGSLEANRANGIELSAILSGSKSIEEGIDDGIAAVEEAMSS